MNQDQSELTLEESVKQVMQTLPPIIREYLSQGRYTPIARNLMAKYGLRIDQGGVLEREIMLLLMGIEDPAEFSKTLAEEARLDQKTVNGIAQDINEQIFVPLREQMRKEPVAATEAAKLAATQPQQPVKSLATAAATPPRSLLAGAKPPQVLVPAPPSQKPALRDVLATVMKAPLAPQKTVSPIPPNLPGVLRPSESFGGGGLSETRLSPVIPKVEKVELQIQLPPKPITKAEPEDKSKPIIPSAPAKPYSIDPYREPIDEK